MTGRNRRTDIIWESLAWPGYEHVHMTSSPDGHTVDGLIIAVLGRQPSRVRYRITLGKDWTFESLKLVHSLEPAGNGDDPSTPGQRRIELDRTAGRWLHNLANGQIDLSGCVDIDIAVTPLTNTLPIRRLNLHDGGSEVMDVVYVAVPEMTITPARQRYTRLTETTYRFESLSSGFKADISVDDQGLVTDYPGLFRRVWPLVSG